MVVTTRGKMVFVAESFSLDLARKLAALILNAQGAGELKLARAGSHPGDEAASQADLSAGMNQAMKDAAVDEPLTGSLVRFFSNCGVMKAAVDALTMR